MVRAFTYIAMHGADGLKDISQYAVLNANYLLARLRKTYHVPFDRICMHEFVAEGQFSGSDVRALDVAKRLMDYNFHPADKLLPAHRPRSADDRADRDREQGYAGCLRRCADQDRGGSQNPTGAAPQRAQHHPVRPHGRGQGRPRIGAVLLAAG